jgi:hypothetical protein
LQAVGNFDHALRAVQANALFSLQIDPVGLADERQDLVRDDLDIVFMCLHSDPARCCNQLHASLVDEQAESLFDAREQAVARCYREMAARRQGRMFTARDMGRLC